MMAKQFLLLLLLLVSKEWAISNVHIDINVDVSGDTSIDNNITMKAIFLKKCNFLQGYIWDYVLIVD